MTTKNDDAKKTQKLSIYLLKEDITDFKMALKDKVFVRTYEIKKEYGVDGIIFIGLEKSSEAGWKDLLQEGTDKKLPDLASSSNRALLFLKVEGRIFVLPFGYGKHLLKDESIERDFGLKTALNLVDADKLRSMDKANLDNLTVLTRTQTSRKAKQEAFDIDIIRDLLKGVTGEAAVGAENLGDLITGSEGIYINPYIDFSDISKSIKQLKKAYESKKYKARFDWIDNLKAEKDPLIIEKLQKDIIRDLQKKDTIVIHISPPYLIDWSGFEGISYTPQGDLETDFEIESFYRIKEDDLIDLDWEKLIRIKIFIKTGDEENRISIPLWRCLNYQAEIGNNLFVFAFGKWYRINKSYAQQIKEYVMHIEESSLPFVNCDKGMHEDGYNIKLANSSPDFELLDQDLVASDLVRSGIEVCDVISKSGEFIHVKFRKSSATLSHLFAQGKISASALLRDRVYRKNLRSKLGSIGLNRDLVPLEKRDVVTSSYTITFAIIEDKSRSFIDSLPFFSLLNFRLTAEELQNWGFNVKVKKIIIT